MKGHLAKNVVFSLPFNFSELQEVTCEHPLTVTCNIIPLNQSDSEKCQSIQRKLEEKYLSSVPEGLDVKLGFENPSHIRISLEGNYLEKFRCIVDDEAKQLGISVEVEMKPNAFSISSISGSTNEIIISREGSFEGVVPLPLSYKSWACKTRGSNWRCQLSIQFTIYNVTPEQYQCSQNAVTVLTQKMLRDGVGCDVTLIADNGTRIPCHKLFLQAHSSVFGAMFQSGMIEERKNEVQMKDMSEEGVRAFLEFIYCANVQEPVRNSKVALELLTAGHMYQIELMEESMRRIFMNKTSEWYDVDVVLGLFLLSRGDGVQHFYDVKTKVIQILKLKLKELSKSQPYDKIFMECGEIAKELFELALER